MINVIQRQGQGGNIPNTQTPPPPAPRENSNPFPFSVRKQIAPGRQLGLSVRQVESYQWILYDGPYILLPVGCRQQMTKFLIDTEAQISILAQQDAEKLGIQPRQQQINITGVNGVSAVCQTAKVNLWLPGEKRMSSTHFAVKDHNENILGFYISS